MDSNMNLIQIETPASMTESITVHFLERCFGITQYIKSIEDPIQQNLIKWLVFRSMQFYFVQYRLFFSNINTLPLQFQEGVTQHVQKLHELAETYLFSLQNRDVRISDIIRDIRELEERMGIIQKSKKNWQRIPIVSPRK
jgi:hypothetical protein